MWTFCMYFYRVYYAIPARKSIYNSNSILYRTWSAGCMTKSFRKDTLKNIEMESKMEI